MNEGMPRRVLERMIEVVKREPSIEQVWLFGSRARGDYRYNSDIDLYLIGEGIRPRVLLSLEEAAGLYKVDIVTQEDLDNPDLASEIDRDKVLLYDRETSVD